jgi:hypothetical protein
MEEAIVKAKRIKERAKKIFGTKMEIPFIVSQVSWVL